MDVRDSAAALEETIERYNAAWNEQDVEAILAFHAPGMVFQNHTAGDRVEGDEVGPHIAGIFERNPDLRFEGRRLYARDGLVVSEWTATATNRDGVRVEWDGVDVFPFESGLILRKDVYSSSHAPRVVDE
jgi:ketosteroid isomerase-like protein